MKKFLTINQQLELLKKNNLKLVDQNDYKYHYYLENFGYHNIINGYNDFFMLNEDRKSNTYKNNVTFDMIIHFFNFERQIAVNILQHLLNYERKLSNIFFTVINETLLKNSSISKKDIQNYYQYGLIFNNLNKYQQIIFKKYKEFDLLINNIWNKLKIKDDNYAIIINKRYNSINEIPSWIINSQLQFGDLIKLMKTVKSNLLRQIIKKINSNLVINNALFIEIQNIFNKIRNMICHNNPLCKYEYIGNYVKSLLNFLKGNNFLKDKNSVRLWNIIELIDLFNNVKKDNLKLTWYLKNKINDPNNVNLRNIPDEIKKKIFNFWNFN